MYIYTILNRKLIIVKIIQRKTCSRIYKRILISLSTLPESIAG